MFAAILGHLDVVKLLVENGRADVNMANNVRKYSSPLGGFCL